MAEVRTKLEVGEPLPETRPAPEAKTESLKESLVGKKESVASEERSALVSIPVPPSAAAVSAQSKDPMLAQIEQMLSDDLFSVYESLPPKAQSEFKSKGEEVATKIQNLIVSAKVVAKDILALIVSWLKIIPGVNSFFLEQEAKIKTDKIMVLAEEEKKKYL